MSLLEFPPRGLTPIDIRIVKVVSAALGWEVEIGRSAESEAFALITPRSHEDIVFSRSRRPKIDATRQPTFGDRLGANSLITRQV